MDENKNTRENAEVTIDLYEILYLLRQKLLILLIALVVGALVGGVVTKVAVTPQYKSTAKLYVTPSNKSVVDLSELQLGSSLAQDYRELLMMRPVLNSLIQNCNLKYSVSALKGMIAISTTSGTRILNITVTSPDPEEAAAIANEMANLAIEVLPEIMRTTAPSITEDAIPPARPSGPNYVRNALIGAVLCAILAAGFFVVRFLMDDSVKNGNDMERLFGTVPLAMIPEEADLADKNE